MSTVLRRKRANGVIYGLLALMMVGLGGYGVTNFSKSVSTIGTVGDRPVRVDDYARGLRRVMNDFTQQMGQPMTLEQAQGMGLDRQVQSQLVAAATLDGEAARLGLSVGDGAVRDRIMKAPALQGPDGKFDRDAYKMFLEQQHQSEADFEGSLRDEASRTLLQGALTGGVKAPAALTDRLAAWQSETRAFTFAELIASDLHEPVPAPTDTDLKGWYDAHNDAYMRPETRKLTTVWLSPDRLAETVQVDEAELKKAYDQRRAEFDIPERRIVERLVYPTADEAAAARARLDKGEVTFEALTQERGLALKDIDLGEQTRDDLGAAGEAVFAAAEGAVAGPVDSDLGPALFHVTSVLAAQETSFDEARDDLRTEVAMDRARRQIADETSAIEDTLASGATLEEVAKDHGMELGTIDYSSDSDEGLAGYEAFRKAAAAATPDAFPELVGLDDGGIFALRLDKIDPAALRPLDEVSERVAEDWTRDQTHAALLVLAGEDIAQIQNGATLQGLGLVTTHHDDLARGGFIADVPAAMAERVFAMTAGTGEVLDAEGRVFLLTLDAITPADLADPEVAGRRDALAQSLTVSQGRDLFDAYARAVQSRVGVTLDQSIIAQVNARMQ